MDPQVYFKILIQIDRFMKFLGSLFWMSPEILNPKLVKPNEGEEANPYTVQSDVYAYGVVLFELFSGELPYCNQPFLQPGTLFFN